MRRVLVLAAIIGASLLGTAGVAQATPSPDGTGALDYAGSPVESGSSGNRLTFTFSLASGEEFQEGEFRITIPTGWSAPSTNSADPGYTTTDCTSVPSISGQVITIEGQNLVGPASCSVTYGAPTSPGVTVPSTALGPVEFFTEARSTLGGTFTAIAASPFVDVVSPDGTGALDYLGIPVGNGSTENGLGFDFSLQAGEEFENGAIKFTVPSGWDPPSDNPGDGGYTTSTCGTVQPAVGQTITITGITLTGPDDCEVFYGDLPGPGVTAPTTAGPYTFDTEAKSTSGGTFASISTSPEVDVLAPDGSGTLVPNPLSVGSGSTGNTLVFTYTAAFGGVFDGTLALSVPAGWSAPDDSDPSAEGFTTASSPGGCGCPPIVLVDGRTVYVFPLVLGVFGVPDNFTVTYGDKSGPGPGATAPAAPGRYPFKTSLEASCDCESQLVRLAESPSIRVRPNDGTGSASVSPTAASTGSTTTLTLKYKPDPGGMENGEVEADVPAGWTAPQTTTPGAPGYVTSTAGALSTNGQEIHVSGLTVFGDILRIQYRGVVGPSLGAQTFAFSQKGSPGGTLTPLPASPQVTVYGADGSGTMGTSTPTAVHGSSGNTLVFTYTAGAGGMSNGVVGLKIPVGWTQPTATPFTAGFTFSTAGIVTIQGQTILVAGVTLSPGSTMTIFYGAGPPGATAPSTIGPKTFTAYSRATNAGITTQLAVSPIVSTT